MFFLKRSVNRTFRSIKNHPLLFTSLILLQIIFIISLFFVSVNFQIKILSDAQQIIKPLENINLDVNSAEEAKPLLKEINKVTKSYNDMNKNIFYYSLSILLLFLILNGLIWILTTQMFSSKKITIKTIKELTQRCFKFSVATIILFFPIMMGSYYLLNSLAKSQVINITKMAEILFYVFIWIYYFMLVSFAFIATKSWKIFLKNILLVSIKKIYWTILILLINLTLLGLNSYFLFLSLYKNSFTLIILLNVSLIFLLILTKIFWVASLNDLAKKNEKNNIRY